MNEQEKTFIGTAAEKFLYEIETMKMDKLYKIPTISALIKNGNLFQKVTAEEIAQSIKKFYENPKHSIDMQDASSKNYLNWTNAQFKAKAISMPIKHISKSSNYFNYDEINQVMYFSDEVFKFNSPHLIEHIEDILEYRLRDKCAKLYKKQER